MQITLTPSHDDTYVTYVTLPTGQQRKISTVEQSKGYLQLLEDDGTCFIRRSSRRLNKWRSEDK
jgi:hypothetical protein